MVGQDIRMHGYDDEVVKAASAAYCDAWNELGPKWTTDETSERDIALALGLGVTAAAARGELTRELMRRSALDHVAIAVFERVGGQVYPRPGHLTHRYAEHAEMLRAMAVHIVDPRQRAALLRCAEDFDTIAASLDLIAASKARLLKSA
jgi:hypothetical protein